MALGFPTEDEFLSLMGYVTDEDRERWHTMKRASDERMKAAGKAVDPKQIAQEAFGSASELARAGMQGAMIGSHSEEAEAERKRNRDFVEKRETTTRIRYFEEDRRPDSDDLEMG